MVGGPDEPHIGRDRQFAALVKQRRCSLEGVRHQPEIAILWIALERRQESRKILFRVREVHLVEHHDVDGVVPTRRACAVESLEEFTLVEPLFEHIVVADQVLRVTPSSLDFDHRRAPAQGPGKGEREAGLAGAADALEQEQAAHGQATEEAAQVRIAVEQLLARDTMAKVFDEGLEIADPVEGRRGRLKLAVGVHGLARGKG